MYAAFLHFQRLQVLYKPAFSDVAEAASTVNHSVQNSISEFSDAANTAMKRHF